MVDVAETPIVAVLTRAPSATGKRRLFGALGLPPDPLLLQALLLDTLDAVLAAGYRVIVGTEPATSLDEMRALVPASVEVVAQAPGDLGDRMRALMAGAFARGATSVVLVGSDLPDLSPAIVHEAVRILRAEPHVVVLGPAADGGYYLVGATCIPKIFNGIDWGSGAVLRQTEAAAAAAGLARRYLVTLHDVDAPSDLASVRARRTCAWAKQARASGRLV